MESGDDGLESEANVHPRPCLTGAGSPGAESTATDRGPSRQARLNRSAEGARTAYSARHTCPKTPETQSRNRSVRQAASRMSRSKWGMTQKRRCHARESGHPDLAARAGALDSRFRGNDRTLKDLILNDAHDYAPTILLKYLAPRLVST